MRIKEIGIANRAKANSGEARIGGVVAFITDALSGARIMLLRKYNLSVLSVTNEVIISQFMRVFGSGATFNCPPLLSQRSTKKPSFVVSDSFVSE